MYELNDKVVFITGGSTGIGAKVIEYLLEENVKTALVTNTLKAVEVMRKDRGGKGGVVLNMSSTTALVQDSPFPVYFATKSAVLQFSNCIGLPAYYDRTGVRVIAICFGVTDTALLSTEKMGNFDQEVYNNLLEILKNIPIQKVESAARGAVDALKQGESGSTWLSNVDKPVKDITETIKKAYSIMSELVFQ